MLKLETYMKKFTYILCCVALLAAPQVLSAQDAAPRLGSDRTIVVENMKVVHTGNNLVLDLDLNMDSLDLPANTRLVFTPMVQNRETSRAMGPIIVNGRRQDISFRRSAYRQFPDDAVSVCRKNHTAQSVHYSASLPYEDWMKNADVAFAEDLCGCGDILAENTHVVYRLRTPYMPFIRPAAEARKERSEEGRAFIDFPVDRIELYPQYRNNPRELAKIIETINVVRNDKNTSITNIEIHGYASPESPYTHNDYLAKNRARTLKDYVCRLMKLDDRIFTVSSTPEDWEGLREYVVKSNLEHKTQILAEIDNTTLDPDVKEWRIKSRYPDEYRFMLDTWYPALRHSDYVVRYTVRPFSVDEAKEILKTKPQQLSLEEMFLVAQTYEPGSPEFNDVMETAVRLYPNDPTANINAACARMELNDLVGAQRYLEKAGNSPEALHALGVLAIKQGRTDEARRLLQQARNAGVADAQKNLDILDL